jgi:hypothetical protein
LEANVKAAVGFQLLIPPDRAHWPRYITAQDVHHHLVGEYRQPVNITLPRQVAEAG